MVFGVFVIPYGCPRVFRTGPTNEPVSKLHSLSTEGSVLLH